MANTVKPVILDHDGGDDDLIALALLLANPDKVRVIGTVVTDGDCFVEHGFSVTGKMMAMMNVEESIPTFPIGQSSLKAVNPFPVDWRWHAKNMDDFPSVNTPAHVKVWESLKHLWAEHAVEFRRSVSPERYHDLLEEYVPQSVDIEFLPYRDLQRR